MLDARSSMLVKDPVSRIEHRVCALVAERLLLFKYARDILKCQEKYGANYWCLSIFMAGTVTILLDFYGFL
ncbi:MAG: hypothetical protein AB1414_15270 [bacterium]